MWVWKTSYTWDKFYFLAFNRRKFFWIWGFVPLCKSDNSFQMQIDFSIKLPNKKCNVFPCYILHVCLLRNIRYIKLLNTLKCNNSSYSHYVFFHNGDLLFIEICIIFLSCLSHVLLSQTRDPKVCVSFHFILIRKHQGASRLWYLNRSFEMSLDLVRSQ